MANEFGILIDSRNGHRPPDTSEPGSQPMASDARPKTAVILTPGCMRGIEDVGAFCALHEEGIAQQVDGYFGVSVGAVGILFANDPLRGLGIFSRLTGYNFIKLSQQGISVPYLQRQVLSASMVRSFQVVGQAASSRIAEMTGLESMRMGAHIDSTFLTKILREETVPDMEIIRNGGKEHRVYCTNARTGLPQSMDLRDCATLDDALQYVDASSRLPFISGKPVHIGGDLLFDGCYSSSYPVHDVASRGYNRIIMMLNIHPDKIMESEGEIGKLIDLYARVHAPASRQAYDEHRANLPAILDEIMSGEVVTEHGTAYVRIIHPEKVEPKMNPLETRPEALEEAFWRGYARGKMFVHQLHREHEKGSDFKGRLNTALALQQTPKAAMA